MQMTRLLHTAVHSASDNEPVPSCAKNAVRESFRKRAVVYDQARPSYAIV